MGIDIQNYYMGTPMAYYQYMRVPAWCIPREVWDDPNYAIHITDNGYVYLGIRCGLYGLKEAGILAFNQLVKKLAPHGNEPMPFTPGLWCHYMKRTTFALCVKYFYTADATHLINAVKAHYDLTIEWI